MHAFTNKFLTENNIKIIVYFGEFFSKTVAFYASLTLSHLQKQNVTRKLCSLLKRKIKCK